MRCERANGVEREGEGNAGGGDKLTDCNVTLSRCPWRRLRLDETDALVAKLRGCGVGQAWAGSFDGLLHKNMAAVNARLAEECRRYGRGVLVPFGLVNPKLPRWEEDVRRCHGEHKMPGIRLHPNYHGYKLDEPVFGELLELANGLGLIVQVAVSVEDERTQHALMQVAHVDTAPLTELLKASPGTRIVLLNWFRAVKGELVPKLASAGQVYFDIATVEGVGGVANLLRQVADERVLFGSHSPFFYFEAAALKLKESELAKAQHALVGGGNARRLLEGARRG